MEYLGVIVAIATMVLYPAIGLMMKLLSSQNKRFKEMDERLREVLSERQTRGLIEDKLTPLSTRQLILESRLDRLEHKIDQILDKL